jgi:hypothetical protein
MGDAGDGPKKSNVFIILAVSSGLTILPLLSLLGLIGLVRLMGLMGLKLPPKKEGAIPLPPWSALPALTLLLVKPLPGWGLEPGGGPAVDMAPPVPTDDMGSEIIRLVP